MNAGYFKSLIYRPIIRKDQIGEMRNKMTDDEISRYEFFLRDIANRRAEEYKELSAEERYSFAGLYLSAEIDFEMIYSIFRNNEQYLQLTILKK